MHATSGGCTGLISSGTSGRESAFLDASQSGDDVFFVTAGSLVSADTDHSLDIYDAHVCSEAEPCLTYPTSSSPECESAASCRPAGSGSPPAETAPPSSTYKGPGNTPTVHVLPYKAGSPPVKPKPLTKAQKLAKALQACRKHHRHSKKKRAACERQARKTYGARPTGKKAKR